MTAEVVFRSEEDVLEGRREERDRSLKLDTLIHQIKQERARQDNKWGIDFKTRLQSEWLTILAEEFGEIAKSVTEYNATDIDTPTHIVIKMEIQQEIIHTAAVCLSWLEFGFPK